jgi:hypothetical protein
MATYEGYRKYVRYKDGGAHESVRVTVDGSVLPLRTDIVNHSPTGHEWGYHGSGPAQLAHAILLHHFGDSETGRKLAQLYYQEYKNRVISRLPREDSDNNIEWTITSNEITATCKAILEGCDWVKKNAAVLRCELPELPDDVRFEPLPDYGDHFTLADFKACCECGGFVNSDGIGDLATATQVSDVPIKPSQILTGCELPTWCTHVVWYNK